MSRKNVLAVLLAVAATLLFVPASPAAAAYAPRLLVTPSDAPGGAITVDLRAPVAERATARTVVYVPLGYRSGAPAPGQHTAEILSELGFSDEDIAVMCAAKQDDTKP